MSAKVFSNDRTSECPTPTLYIREYDCGSTKTSKTCSKDWIYRELEYEDDAFVLIEVIVEFDKFASVQ